MAIFRKVHVQFWSDVFIQSLTPEQKFFFLYLLTNERTKQCGIYEITTRQISYDTGYNVETINKLIDFFEGVGKILFSRQTNEIAIKNWDKYNSSRSPDVQRLVNKELKSIKNIKLIEWLQSVDTVSPQYEKSLRGEVEPEREPEREREPDRPPTKNVIFDVEKLISENQKQFETICMNANYLDAGAAKESLRKFHLYLQEKEKYPQTKSQLFAGFEKWLLNEKKFSNGATHKQFSSTNTKRPSKSDGAEKLIGLLKAEISANIGGKDSS